MAQCETDRHSPWRMMAGPIAVCFVLLLTEALLAPASAAPFSDTLPAALREIVTTLPARAVEAPIAVCTALPRHDFGRFAAAPFRILSARVTLDKTVCEVDGYVTPQVGFKLRLPIKTYTGRYLQLGCGGLCGYFPEQMFPACDNAHAAAGAFAVAVEDGGHRGVNLGDGTWALGSKALRQDFAYRAAHVTALAAKDVIAAYYGRRPQYAYFQGCSDGGREALMEAERYPHDFDGIVAGSTVSMAAGIERMLWEAHVGLDRQGHEILTPAAVGLLHKAVLAACDGLDGVEDGQIDDPRRCHYDPARLACAPGQNTDCLTAQQVEAVRAFYRGPVDAQGDHLFPGGDPYGSELGWERPDAATKVAPFAAAAFLKQLVFPGELPPDFSWRDWRFDRASFERLMRKGALYDSTDPDLRPFRRAGGKLILWQGTADNTAGIYGMLSYYQAVRDIVGGLKAARSFARLYLVPAGYHCTGGYVAYEEDFLGAMVAWVERHHVPDRITSAAILSTGIVRRRPLFAYPAYARYRGGDINADASFKEARPVHAPDDHYDWLGTRFRVHFRAPARPGASPVGRAMNADGR